MTLLLQILWTLLAAMTVENLLLPGTLGFSRMLRAARKPEHRAWYAIFVGIFSAISLELSLLIPPQLFPAYANVLRPLCLALCAAAAYLAASFALRRLLPGFLRRHGSVLAPAAINTVVLALPYARQTLALDAIQGLAYAAGTALMFYRLMKALGVDITYNHADYRLMSARALEALSQFGEVNLFLRGIVPLIGYRSDYVYYDRHERFAGESKYPLKKMISFALDGITSFSVRPLRLISRLGIFVSMASVLGLLYALISHFLGHTVAGWTAIVCSIWLLGGIQLLCIGVVGGYVGKIYSEVKARPRYRIEQKAGEMDDSAPSLTGQDGEKRV